MIVGRARPLDVACAALVIGTSAYVIIGPFTVARYPMMTDLPFHAANAAILRHYWDPAWHFQEQFVLQPLSVPYLSMYLIAALLMTFMSALSAIKVAAVVMLALLPIGLSVLAWGMKKSPLLGVLGLSLVWCGLSSWGFLNFLGALGLFAAALGLTFRQIDRPRLGTGWWLSLVLVAILFTHPFRFPFAIAICAACALALRGRRALWPLILPALAFVAWWLMRPAELDVSLGPLALHPERLAEAGDHLYRSLRDPREAKAGHHALETLSWLAVALAALGAFQRQRLPARWTLGAPLLVLAAAGSFLLLYLTLPMQIGAWWYVYPREVTSAAYVALGVMPDLPRSRLLRLATVALLALTMLPLGKVVIDNWRVFDRATRDFDVIVARVPRAPKLLYLVFDHSGAPAVRTPFIHLPAYVQADKGGWLSFHFAGWGTAPAVYRKPDAPGAVVPPPVPLRWEWTPERFEVLQHGRFFDWFMVRAQYTPSALFRADPSIDLVAHEGRWWLYRRR